MIILDCESRESALASIAAIYGISTDKINAFLHEFDLNAHCELLHFSRPPDEELRLNFESALCCEPMSIDRICWFHLTRTHPASDFSDGIQPLSISIDHVWEAIFKVFRGTRHEGLLSDLRRDGVPDRHYQLKAHDPFHAGPYAMLVRAVATCSHDIGNHDYLWLPEIMEDVCNGYEQAHGESIHDTLNQALVPKIVKFWTANRNRDDCIDVALQYLYCTVRNSELHSHANTCFEGENKAIPPGQILGVEVVEGHQHHTANIDQSVTPVVMSLSGILCLRHSMSKRSIYANESKGRYGGQGGIAAHFV